METPATPTVPASAAAPVANVDVTGTARIPAWLRAGLMVAAIAALWLVAFDNGQASGMVDTTGTALHELFHDARHLSGAPCH